MEIPEKCGAPTTSPIIAASHHPVTLKFEDVVYRIRTCRSSSNMKNSRGSDALSGAGGKSDDHRFILKGVSGTVLPGEMLALMGPSGSGKTTLLTALGGRLQAEGSITYNGRTFSDSSMKRNMGFVTQDDILYQHLTVGETLVYTALLRLPRQLSRRQKAAQAEGVMWQLGLAGCGDSLVRGVSGGERKRVSIGQEMLVNPSLLLLDEPTSGLDSTTAQRIVSTLWELSRGGRTVLMTIHQPSSRLFYMFDRLLLLSDGSPVYFGRASEAMDHFASVGFAPRVPMNPADFLLDLANGVYFDESTANDERTSVREEIVLAYRQQLEGKVLEEIQEMYKQFNDGEAFDKRSAAAIGGSKWVTSWWEQFTVLLRRGLKERRHESFSALKIAQVLIVAILSGCLWWQSGDHAQDQVGLLFFISGFWCFFPVFQAIFTFPQELSILNKERSSGMYRLSSYFTARMVGDLPMELLLPTIFTVIVYWMAGMKPTAAHFFATLTVILLGVLAAQGLGLAIGALIMDLKSATTLASVVLLTFMLAGGYYVQQVPAFIAWLKYISLNFYTFKLLASSQYSPNETYRCQGQTCKVADLPSVKLVGLDNYAVDIIVLLATLVFYRLVAYLALTRVGHAVARR